MASADRILYLGTSDGLFRAEERGGESFCEILSGLPQVSGITVTHREAAR